MLRSMHVPGAKIHAGNAMHLRAACSELALDQIGDGFGGLNPESSLSLKGTLRSLNSRVKAPRHGSRQRCTSRVEEVPLETAVLGSSKMRFAGERVRAGEIQ